MKSNRLFGIIYLLLSKQTITAKDLADYFEVSTRTIYRDVEVLSSLGIPIYMSKGKNGGIGLLENYKLDKALLTEEEQKQILFSIKEINGLNIEVADLFKKLKTVFDKEEENWFDVDFGIWGNSSAHKENFELIKKAILSKLVIEFNYSNSYGTKSNKRIEPLQLCFKYSSWYVYGFDKDKEDYRLYKITRIKNLKLSETTFERNIPKQRNVYNDPINLVDLELEVNKELSYRIHDEFDESSITPLDSGNFLIKVKLPENEWLYGYILSFGEHIKVIEPEHIRNKIINKLQKNIKNYL